MLRWIPALLSGLISCAAAAEEPDSGALMIVSMVVNEVAKGDAMAIPADTAGAAWWLREPDFGRTGIYLPDLPRTELEGEQYVRVPASEDLQIVLDAQQLVLHFTAVPALLGTQKFSLSRAVEAEVSPAPGPHGYMNYDIRWFDADGTRSSWSATLGLNIAVGGWVLHSDHDLNSGSDENPHLRLQTLAFRDFDARRLRVSLGDVQAYAGFLGRGGPAGGVTVERLYEIDPGFVRTPVASLRGSVDTPSTAEVYVDGSRVKTIRLEPGQYQLEDLYYFAGLRDVEVRLRSVTGNTEILSLPFYFSESNLRAGLHEFSYTAGTGRTIEPDGNHYGGHILTGYHRYGATDALTVSVQGELQGDYLSLGGGAVWSLGRLGQLAGNAVVSNGDAGSGQALFVGYGYSGGRFSLDGTLLYQTRDFGVLEVEQGVSLGAGRLQTQATAGASVGIGADGNLSLTGSYARYHDLDDSAALGMRYNRNLGHGFTLGVTFGGRMDGRDAGAEGSLTLSWNMDRDWTASTRLERAFDSSQVREVSLSNGIPSGTGSGGGIGWEQTLDTESREAFLQHNARRGVISAAAREFRAAGAAPVRAGEVRAAGSIAVVDGESFIGRPIQGGFAVADVSGIEGVRVYQNNQLVGTTSDSGRLLVPGLGDYTVNQLRIDDRDIPMDYSLAEITRTVVPRTGMAAMAKFESARLSAAGGLLVSGQDGSPVKSAAVTLAGPDLEAVTSTGPDGDFYVENIGPGRYTASVEAAEYRCDAVMEIAAEDLPFADLGEVVCVVR